MYNCEFCGKVSEETTICKECYMADDRFDNREEMYNNCGVCGEPCGDATICKKCHNQKQRKPSKAQRRIMTQRRKAVRQLGENAKGFFVMTGS
jgi:predicted amidophosphoribosyltransferase